MTLIRSIEVTLFLKTSSFYLVLVIALKWFNSFLHSFFNCHVHLLEEYAPTTWHGSFTWPCLLKFQLILEGEHLHVAKLVNVPCHVDEFGVPTGVSQLQRKNKQKNGKGKSSPSREFVCLYSSKFCGEGVIIHHYILNFLTAKCCFLCLLGKIHWYQTAWFLHIITC